MDPKGDDQSFTRAFASLNRPEEPIVYFGEQYDFSKYGENSVDSLTSVHYYRDIVNTMVGKDWG